MIFYVNKANPIYDAVRDLVFENLFNKGLTVGFLCKESAQYSFCCYLWKLARVV